MDMSIIHPGHIPYESMYESIGIRRKQSDYQKRLDEIDTFYANHRPLMNPYAPLGHWSAACDEHRSNHMRRRREIHEQRYADLSKPVNVRKVMGTHRHGYSVNMWLDTRRKLRSIRIWPDDGGIVLIWRGRVGQYEYTWQVTLTCWDIRQSRNWRQKLARMIRDARNQVAHERKKLAMRMLGLSSDMHPVQVMQKIGMHDAAARLKAGMYGYPPNLY